MFWLATGVLALLAVGFTAWPFLRGSRNTADSSSRGDVIRALYKDRLAELEAEASAGQLDSETRAQVAEELGANLLAEYQEQDPGAARPARARRGGLSMAVWLTAVLIPGLAVAVYFSAGEPGAGEVVGASAVLELDPETQRPEIRAWAERLDRRVARRPEDAQSLYLLGVSRLQLGEFSAAAQAFARASELVVNDPNVDLYWLQSRYLAAGGEMDEQSRRIADRILESRPNHPLVMEMFAIEAYRQGRFRQAVEHLNRALNNPLPRSQMNTLLGGLREARSRMGDLSPSVDVDVSAPADAPRDATLFVIARPPAGGMPYAVVRRPAAMLPLSVRLDDTTTMGPVVSLSDAEEVQIVVRLSRSGNPTAGPGDWEWRSPVLRLAERSSPVELEAALTPRAAEG